MKDPRVVKPVLPIRVVVSACAIGLLLFAVLIYAVCSTNSEIQKAKMTGLVVKKEFDSAVEDQLTLHREGGLTTRHKDGDYILTVEVPQSDGSKKPYYVWVNKIRYDSTKIGDSFDVGPALVHE